jgi:hypothetical protein
VENEHQRKESIFLDAVSNAGDDIASAASAKSRKYVRPLVKLAAGSLTRQFDAHTQAWRTRACH